MQTDELLTHGREALKRGDWAAARDALQQAVALHETPESLEDLSTALWWLDDQANVLEARESAFRLYRTTGDIRSSARMATFLGLDYIDYRGDLAVGNGWFQRAESLLGDIETAPEHGWHHLYRGFTSLMFEGDSEAAWRHQRAATEIGKQLGVFDIEMMSVTLEGLTLIREGNLAQGMRRLDEGMAAAVSGEMTDLPAIGMTCCAVIYACEAIADYDRAAQWCNRAMDFCRRLGLNFMFAICRNYYATVLIWKGAWTEAAEELAMVARTMPETRSDYLRESYAKLGELRRRQGRLDEAEKLFQQADPHRLSLMGRAALALDRNDPQTALDFLERQIRRIGEEDLGERAFALSLRVQAQIMQGNTQAAADSLREIEAAVSLAGTQPLRATVNAAQGALAQAQGQLDRAKLHYEDAVDFFEASEAEFEAARIRLELAGVLHQQGRDAAAMEQVIMAQGVFKRLGAAIYSERASALVASLAGGMGNPPGEPLPYNLTPREAEVLWLIAAGKTNQEIAEELVLSVRTVERHISTVYEKLNLHGRAARASAAAIAVNLRANT